MINYYYYFYIILYIYNMTPIGVKQRLTKNYLVGNANIGFIKKNIYINLTSTGVYVYKIES